MSENKLAYRHLQDQSFGNLLQILENSVCCALENSCAVCLPDETGTNGQVLTVVEGAPEWADAGAGGGVESVTATNASVVVNNTDPLNPVVGLPYLVYRALLNQTGTDAPTAIVLENTLGEVPTFAYDSPGLYFLNTVGNVFTTNKTFLLVKSTPGLDWAFIFSAQVNGQNQVALNVTNIVSTLPVDGEFSNTSIEILVYS